MIKIFNTKTKYLVVIISLTILELLGFLYFFPVMSSNVMATIGVNNTVRTTMEVSGYIPPEITNVTVNNGNSIDLVANSTYPLNIFVIGRDFNGKGDIANISVRFYDNTTSSYAGADDNNSHYTNSSCKIDFSYGDAYQVSANCSVSLWYYANNATWIAETLIEDNETYTHSMNGSSTVNSLISLGLPDSLDYGLVNATLVSDEKIMNITNYGNTQVNISIEGYGVVRGDNLSMNCTLGSVKNISIYYEKYNLTASNTSSLNLTQFNLQYVNLTSDVGGIIRKFDLPSKVQDNNPNDAINSTYWRMYVPTGVAGNCSGNLIIGARRAAGS